MVTSTPRHIVEWTSPVNEPVDQISLRGIPLPCGVVMKKEMMRPESGPEKVIRIDL
jgi:hypothetical protein